MKRLIYLGAILGILYFCNNAATAGILMGPIVYPANGNSYYLLTRNLWADSEAEADSLGGHLTTINDAAEDAFVFSTFGPTAVSNAPTSIASLWTGLNDLATEGNFVWVSGEPVSYTNWSAGQPQGSIPDEDFGAIFVASPNPIGVLSGQWHDVVGDERFNEARFGVVEVIIPEPSGLSLAGTIALVGFAMRRSC